eukprot:127038_1
MGLFSCFDRESEHLIFETRLHIKDIWIPTEGLWVGPKMMNALSLYDLIVHGNIVNKRLLKDKIQNRLCNLLNSIKDETISTTSLYFKSLVSSLITDNDKIWLNTHQIQELNNNLKELFIGPNEDFGDFILYLKQKTNLLICPVFATNYHLTKQTFNLITRVSEKYDKVKVAGRQVICNLFGKK